MPEDQSLARVGRVARNRVRCDRHCAGATASTRVTQYSVWGVGPVPKRALTANKSLPTSAAVVGTSKSDDVISPTTLAVLALSSSSRGVH